MRCGQLTAEDEWRSSSRAFRNYRRVLDGCDRQPCKPLRAAENHQGRPFAARVCYAGQLIAAILLPPFHFPPRDDDLRLFSSCSFHFDVTPPVLLLSNQIEPTILR